MCLLWLEHRGIKEWYFAVCCGRARCLFRFLSNKMLIALASTLPVWRPLQRLCLFNLAYVYTAVRRGGVLVVCGYTHTGLWLPSFDTRCCEAVVAAKYVPWQACATSSEAHALAAVVLSTHEIATLKLAWVHPQKPQSHHPISEGWLERRRNFSAFLIFLQGLILTQLSLGKVSPREETHPTIANSPVVVACESYRRLWISKSDAWPCSCTSQVSVWTTSLSWVHQKISLMWNRTFF